MKSKKDTELEELIRENIGKTIGVILFLFVAFLTITFIFNEPLKAAAHWIMSNFGVTGLALIVFIGDIIFSPFPPDMILYLLAQSDDASNWKFFVSILSIASFCAGIVGWFIGTRIHKLPKVQRWLKRHSAKYLKKAKRFAFWMVFLGALTPIPFSITCWLAGFFKMKLWRFALASCIRIPRFFLYYWAISQSVDLGKYLRILFDLS